MEKSYIIYKFSCHCGSDYEGKSSERFLVRINQHVPKTLKSWFDGRSEKPAKKYFSATRQHFFDKHECARNYKEEKFQFK